MPHRRERWQPPWCRSFRLGLVVIVGTGSLTACSNRSVDVETGVVDSAPITAPTTATASTAVVVEPVTFGDLASPCGPGSAFVEPGENGGERLVVAVPTDRGAVFAPGLAAEMYDVAGAFAAWCNEQGGIAGLEIEIFDADARLFEVDVMIERVCDTAFAMVGGGWAFDELQFPRFDECGMIDIAGYTVSAAKALSDGMVQPVPNPPNRKNVGWLQWARDVHPDAVGAIATIYPDVVTTRVYEEQFFEEMELLGGFGVVDRVPYSATGEANWVPFAYRLKAAGAAALVFLGTHEQLLPLLRAAREVGLTLDLLLLETNLYSETILGQGLADGAIVRSHIVPFEEADRSPATALLLELLAVHAPGSRLSAQSVQAMSAHLLFATGARACIERTGGLLERACVLDAVRSISDWTGGGLHAPTDPGRNEPPSCYLLMRVEADRFARHHPLIGAPGEQSGFACEPGAVLDLFGDYG
jgi:hypothetical protein